MGRCETVARAVGRLKTGFQASTYLISDAGLTEASVLQHIGVSAPPSPSGVRLAHICAPSLEVNLAAIPCRIPVMALAIVTTVFTAVSGLVLLRNGGGSQALNIRYRSKTEVCARLHSSITSLAFRQSPVPSAPFSPAPHPTPYSAPPQLSQPRRSLL